MEVVQWRPFGEPGIPGRGRDNLWNQLFNGAYFPKTVSHEWIPRVDVCRTNDNILIKAELPGMGVKDIHVDISGNLLTIIGNDNKDDKKSDHSYCVDWYISDCRSFQHAIKLPADVQVDKARATFDKGILEIIFPKMEEPRKEK